MKNIKPYNNLKNKKTQITNMFDNIAPTYDFINGLMTFKMDVLWRKKAVKKINNNPKKILDIATGTGELAIIAAKYTDAIITGLDISKKMIDIGLQKIKKQNLSDRISFLLADAEILPFKNQSFNAITIGFGLRNFENMDQGLRESYRVLKNNGVIVIIEPSIPDNLIFKCLHRLYFSFLVPILGKIISKDKYAYQYLIDSVKAFPSQNIILNKLRNSGFKNCNHTQINLGIISLYTGHKLKCN